MRVEVRVPQLSMGMSEAEIVAWCVDEGAHVELDADLVDVEAEKAQVTIPAPSAGIVRELQVAAGDVVAVRDLLCIIEAAE